MSDDRLVTPEAVQLDLPTATVATRALGRLLDLVVQGTLLMLVLTGMALVELGDGTVSLVIILIAIFLIRLAYPVLLETRWGATLGQRAMGLRVRTTDGGPIRARQAVVRAAVGMFEIEMTLGLLAFIVAASRRDGRRLGDIAAGTVALSVRVGTAPAQRLEVTTPSALRGWAAAVDPSGMDQPRRVALRRYHERAGAMLPEARDAIATPLAQRLVADLGLGWPTPASAHDVLCAIAASVATSPAPAPRSTPGQMLPPEMPQPPSARPPSVPPEGAAPQGVTPPPGGFRPPA